MQKITTVVKNHKKKFILLFAGLFSGLVGIFYPQHLLTVQTILHTIGWL